MEYKVIEKKEILSEIASGTMGKFAKVFKKLNIDMEDNKNSIVILFNIAIKLKNSILGNETNTIEKLNDVQSKFQLIDEYLKELM